MKKKVFSLMMTLVLAFVGLAHASELTVNDGTTTNGYVPVYGYYADAYLKAEFVMPAADLAEMNGATINGMTFYASQTSVSWGAASFQVFLTEVGSATISAFNGPGTVVYEGALSIVDGQMVVNFTTPYQYNGGNLLVGFYNTVTGDYVTSSWYGVSAPGASVQGYSYSDLASVSPTQRNFLPKTTFAYAGGGGGGGTSDVLTLSYNGDEVDNLHLGALPGYVGANVSPNWQGPAWMEPKTVYLVNDNDTDYEISVLDFTPSDGLFVVETWDGEPFTIAAHDSVALGIKLYATPEVTGTLLERQFVAIYNGTRTAMVWPISADVYSPYCPDIYELALNVDPTQTTGWPFVNVPLQTLHESDATAELHNDYTLPFPEIPEGYDAVYKLEFENDVLLSAAVTAGADGKVALYREDFNGEGGPMATNAYNGPMSNGAGGGGGAGTMPYTAQIGEGTNTFGYFPFYTLYNYTIAENLFLASELQEAGVTSAPMGSLSWYATNAPGYAQQGISIWMANVDDTELTTTSHTVDGMTLVYTGAMTPEVGWNQFTFNEGNFAWDGHSNILIFCQRNNGEWNSTVSWQAGNAGFNASSYRYQDSGAYDVTVANPMYTSTTRPNIIMKSVGRGNRDEITYGFESGLEGWTVIDVNAAGGTWLHSSQNPSGYDYTSLAHTGTGFAMCYSYVDYVGSFNTDSYLVSPQKYSIGSNGATLSFWADNANDSYPESFSVCVSTAANPTAADFTTVWSGAAKGANGEKSSVRRDENRYENWRLHNVNLNAYAGQDIWIAFHDVNYDEYEVWIDDVTITVNGGGGGGGTAATISFDFEDGTIPAEWTNDANYPWVVTTVAGHDGNCLKSGNAGVNSSDSDLTFDIELVEDGSVSFDYRASCESATYYWDYGQFFVDGTSMERYLDAATWSNANFPLTAGTHTLTWRFHKDSSSAGGDDCFYVDNITITGVAGDEPDPGYIPAPEIVDMPVQAGRYYLVASSTDMDFEVTINATDMPCPELAFNPVPFDGETGVEPGTVELKWHLGEYTTGWRIIIGTTYFPDPAHPQTIMYPEDGSFTTELAQSFIVRNLWNNTQYFWRVDEQNSGAGCPEGITTGETWGFTTHLNVPTNLRADDETIFEDETLVLRWNSIVDRTFRTYRIYQDGQLIGNTTITPNPNTYLSYQVSGLAYNMNGYMFQVSAVYDEGESALSDPINVKVSGYGQISGYVYEQDYDQPVPGATVTYNGLDEFGDAHTYNFTTNNYGYYTGTIYAGDYSGQASKEGYQTAYEPVYPFMNPVSVYYDFETEPVNYILDENFDPVCGVIAEYYPDSLDPTSPYVKVYWGCGLPGSDIIEDFETGDFSMFDWQVASTYPWQITTYQPYEGLYCMKSGNEGADGSTSTMEVSVEIPRDGEMSFFSKISSEQGWDYGYFYIDGQQMGQYSGVGSWGERTFPITAGTHTFTWSYYKDAICCASGDDCFYVDYITFYRQPAPPAPGWHTYCESEFNNALGSNLTTTPSWAYEYPAAFLHNNYAGWNMTKVSLFSDNMYSAVGGNYTCRIYVGGNEPAAGTMVSTLTVDVPSNQNAWVDWDLTTPVNVTGNDAIWVVWTANSTVSNWPAGLCDGQNDYGNWWDGGNGWEHQTYGTWTMRHYFTNRSGRSIAVDVADIAPTAIVDANPINSKLRTYVKGDNTVNTVCANPNAQPGAAITREGNTRALSHYRVYRTNCYNDGPYTEENTVLLATVWVPDTIYIDVEWSDLPAGVYKWGVGTVYEGNRGELTESEINWSEPVNVNNAEATRAEVAYDFEGDLQGWTSIDADGDGRSWFYSMTHPVYDQTGKGHNGTNGFAISASYQDGGVGAFNANNYLVSPQMFAIQNGSSIDFWADYGNDMYPDYFEVCVATAANPTAADFTMVWGGNAKGNGGQKSDNREDRAGNWRSHNVDLSAYAGQNVWIAFHHQDYDEYEVYIDDVTVNAGGAPTPGVNNSNYLALPRESETMWSNCLERDMWLYGYDGLTVTVLLNSADNPAGTTVSFRNYSEIEEDEYPMGSIELDSTGFYVFDMFRKGEYEVTVENDGYYTIYDSVSVWNPTDLRYVMEEILFPVDQLYVSSTGWAMWGPMTGGGGGTATGDEFSVNFDDSQIPAGWTTIDGGTPSGYGWQIGSTKLGSTGNGHNGSADLVLSQSYDNNYGVVYPDNWLISPAVTLGNSSQFSLWACGQDASYAAEHFGVFVSTTGTNPSDFTMVGEWTLTAKGDRYNGPRGDRAQGTWYQKVVDLGEYAGEGRYIAIRHFNCSDMFYLDVDDIELTNGRSEGDRHLEFYKVMCTSLDGEPIFNANTPVEQPFCQLATDALVPGEHYICQVACVYSTGTSAWTACEWQYIPCENYAPSVNGIEINGNTLSWEYPGGEPGPTPPGQGDTFTVNFDDSQIPAGWTLIDGGTPSGYGWQIGSTKLGSTGNGHNGSADLILSQSYDNNYGVVYPDNWLISPAVTLSSSSQFSLWACGQDASYAAEHFGVFVSTTGTNPSDFTMVGEWTLTAKGDRYNGPRGDRAQGNWYQKNVDLGAYAGQGRYIAVRHFNCSDMFYLDVDDLELSNGAKGNRAEWSFFNGHVTDPGAMANGGDASWTKGSQTTWGPNVNNGGGYMLADSFTLDAATTIDEIEVYGYQTGSSTTSTFTGLYAQIYNGAPNSASVVWGDANTNIMTSTAFTNCYRGSDGETTATTRPIMSVTASNLNIQLEAGTYYLVYSLAGSGSSGPWGAPHAEPGVGNTGNGMQYTSSGWQNLSDSGAGTTYGCSMYLHGTTGSGPAPQPGESSCLGAMIFADGEWEAFVEYPTNEYTYEGDASVVCVRMVYDGTAYLPEGNIYFSMSCPECEPWNGGDYCEPGDPIHGEYVWNDYDDFGALIWWGEQVPPIVPVEEWLYYDDGTYATSIGVNGGTIWWASMFPANVLTPYAGTSLTKVALYENSYNTDQVTVSIYLGGANAPQTLVSTQNFNPVGADDFHEVTLNTPVAIDGTQNVWIVFSEYGTYPANACADTGDANNRWCSLDGSEWMDVATAGVPGYGWMIRGFVTNQAKGVHNIAIENSKPEVVETSGLTLGHTAVVSKPAPMAFMNNTRSELIAYNVYRANEAAGPYELIAVVPAVAGQTYYEWFDDEMPAGHYYYQVTAVYDNGCESEPAPAFDNPTVDYVDVYVTAIDENTANVAIYPNPTNGNVKIEAEGMNHITVVSVLGQMVYDADVNADELELNMAQFNTGVYVVRIVTENGISTQRVTVVR